MKKIFTEIELIKGHNDSNVIFHIHTNSIFRINDFTFQLLDEMKSDKVIDFNERGIEKKSIEQFLDKIENATKQKELISTRKKTKEIDRLTLMISNDCNLNCTYCYGDGGSYKKAKTLMSEETAKSIIEFFVKDGYTINSIVFFGGEPLLNIPIIEYVCNYYQELKTENKISRTPDYGMITNGTIINERVVNLIKKHNIGITVSIDGPQDINDKNRIFNDGRGSFELINEFITTIKKEPGRTMMAECTFTEEHEKLGYNSENLTEYFKEQFDINSIIVPELSLEEKKLKTKKNYSYINEYFDKAIDAATEVNNDVLDSLYYLTKNIQCENCRIGEKMLAITTEGEIYPCHMNASSKKTSLGNIFGENIFSDYDKFIKENSYLKVVQKLEGECGKCWAKNLCAGCSVKKFFNREKEEYTTYPNTLMCEETKEYFRTLISNVSLIQSKPEIWSKFVIKINEVKLSEQECV